MFELLVLFGAGVIFGAVIANVLRLVWTGFGTLKIDRSNPEKDLYMFEVNDIDSLPRKKRIVLKIVKTTNLSQN